MDFGKAIEALKSGKRVARAGWNGKGMWLCLATEIDFVTKASLAEFEGLPTTVLPAIVMFTATKEFVIGWLASQTDMLAEDWQILE